MNKPLIIDLTVEAIRSNRKIESELFQVLADEMETEEIPEIREMVDDFFEYARPQQSFIDYVQERLLIS